MSILSYLKERWITYTFILFVFLFSAMVYMLDKSFSIRESNAQYIVTGWGLFFTAYAVIDYGIINIRVKRFKNYCQLNASAGDLDEFSYPVDREYGRLARNIAVENEVFKAELGTKSAEEMEFITRWLHDAKVPISAAKLILENKESELPGRFYQDMYTEIFSIEESIQRVFYEMKTNRFIDDYKITRVSSKKLISQALKAYSNFFSYKKISISIQGEDCDVLTDEKWSGYILSQIISNAVKYSPYEGSIVISTRTDEKETTISIENKGKGILDKDLGQIFQKGYTSSENRAGMKSTGYGLYLSKKLSDLLGHRLTVQSQCNEYAIFSLSFIENVTMHNVTRM
ncbi:MAG TPA: sensor histidine kinase [Patescibacteria group bacterium]|nr:sensor histidine kinase [Patescibacteria group bacterium]